MLFHLRRNPAFGQHGLGFDWLDVLAIVPVAVGTEEKTWDGGQVTQNLYRDLVCRTPDGLRVIAGHDVSYTFDGEPDPAHEYYLAEKE
jgi:hypothetical protein